MFQGVKMAAMAAMMAGVSMFGAIQVAQAAPALSSNPADFTSLTTVINFNTIPAADPIVGQELTNQAEAALGILFAGGFYVYLDPGSSTVFGTNFSDPLGTLNNPVGIAFASDITQIAFEFEAASDIISLAVSKDGGPLTVFDTGISGGVIGIVDPAGLDAVYIAVAGGGGFLLNVFAYGGEPDVAGPVPSVPVPSTLLLGMACAAALLGLRNNRRTQA